MADTRRARCHYKNMLRLIYLSCLFVIASALLANAEGKEPSSSVLFSWYPTEEACNYNMAEPVSLDLLLNAPDDYRDKCVRTEGFYAAGALFMRERDLRRKYPSHNEESAERRLGVYAKQDEMEKLSQAQGKLIELVGLVSNCDSLWSENTIMVMGYCHYTGGPIIGLAPRQ